MSKDSDSVPRAALINGLEDVTEYDELCFIKLLPNVKITAKCGYPIRECFKTETRACEGNGASAKEFAFYLAKS